ncbi:ferredoxin reductase family protein [Aeromonas salmonicida]|uniref:ferredoxin reductase family protein n=1 Tax=Aeromonas salmonicida TaxID=645 RepID=UPI002865AB0A|nr:ferric reductase-like transmembrane domain-containing protein [Aeromonas salmonicida]MDR6995668.1 putative ferric reductase [Aeromonas salmonicida]MDR7019674.1 putative ferric reductase [Aeromonas salmonicida]
MVTKRALWLLPVLAALIWWAGYAGDANGVWPWRHEMLLLTGLLGLGYMALTLLLALRLPRLEVWCGGLDRMLRLHRHSAMAATLALTSHWLLVEAPKWAVTAGWLTRPARRGAGGGAGAGAGNGLSLHALGNTLGEWSFYLLIALVVVSLLSLVSYGRFRVIHRLAPLIYLAGWVHGLCLLPQVGLLTPVGLGISLLGGAGAVAAVYSLLGLTGQRDRHQGRIVALRTLEDSTREFTLQLETPLSHYRPGQFAFFEFDAKEGPHPFTLVWVSPDKRQLVIAVRALGDHTRQLVEAARVDGPVTVTGPYGAFVCPPRQGQSLWLGAGIGITPFVAWLEGLVARSERGEGITLIQCASDLDGAVYHQRLAELCQRTGVRYRLHLDKEAGRLDLAGLAQGKPGDVWFCGPEGMADTLTRLLPGGRLHRELFRFR